MTPAAAIDHEFENLLDYLKRNRGFDFTGYKRSSLLRRIQKRMQTVQVEGYGNYVDFLEVYPDEFGRLFDTVLINVTAFFRDAPAWEFLSSDILPRILAEKKPEEPIRLWCAACASGEEAYSLAIALAEIMGMDAFRERVKIYATDADEDALGRARQATFGDRDVHPMPPDLVERYFEQSDDRHIFRKDLRRTIIFGRHDLIQDAPISRIDLLSCRNCLMYFNAEIQNVILARFYFALNEGGFLFLGKAETLLTHNNPFTPADLKHRVFTKTARTNLRDRVPGLSLLQSGHAEMMGDLALHARIREAAFDAGSIAQIVVDLQGALVLANEKARLLFGLDKTRMGRPLQDYELSYRPVELRSLIEQAYATRSPVGRKEVEWRHAATEARWLDLEVTPLFDISGVLLGGSVTFTDVSRNKRLREDLDRSDQELETALEELQSTVEELETTNEELQSTVEELETTNEELETMNEELRSTNEELETMNEEIRQRGEDLNRSNGFLESILSGLRGGVVVLDSEMRVRTWNEKAENLWGLRETEAVGKHLLSLDIGLPVEQIIQPIRGSLSGEMDHDETVLIAINRRGKPIECRITSTPLAGPEKQVLGVILLMEEMD